MKRRTFVEKSSVGSLGIMSAAYLPNWKQEETVRIGMIGCGWYGIKLAKAVMGIEGFELVSLCDIDTEHLKSVADEIEQVQGSRPKAYAAYQELLDKDNLQAVIIASPPHWHALQFIDACQRGLDIYCCKPLAYDINEGLAMIKAAKEADNIVQIGFMQRSNVVGDKIRSLIQEGRLGKVHQIGAQIHYNPSPGDPTIQDPPPSLDWDTWCGPAPKLPYRPSIGHFNWRLEKEYGNGHLVDWGIHYIDYLRKTMDLGTPHSVQATGDNVAHKGQITTPDTLQVRMDFDTYPMVWNHRMWGTGDLHPEFNSGYTFYGEEATMYGDFKRLILQPKGKGKEAETIEVPTPGVLAKDLINFLEAVQSRDKSHLLCPIEEGFQSTAAVQLAMISYYTQSKIVWDQEKKTIVNNEQAAKLLARPYRGDYTRPTV
ncbi:MAG: Gfo/Idh/MocA family oxidoreductase [Bacteroidota bacterium]